MARFLPPLLLPCLLLLSTSSSLGHAKPHISQNVNDGSKEPRDLYQGDGFKESRDLYQEGPAGSGGTIMMGDMLVSPSLYDVYFNSSYVAPRKGISLDSFLWPREDGVPTIPYAFADWRYKTEIVAGMRHWEQHTCLAFRPRRSYDAGWLTFIHDDGCYSNVGRMGNSQEVSIGTGCQGMKTVVHELGHAIGLLHEQMRSDRDEHVVINWHNIDQANKINFMTATNLDDSRGVAYDYTSIMHYMGRDFSSNGRSTIATMQPQYQGLMGRAKELSHRDKHIVNIMYGCIDQWKTACPSAVTCEGEGYLGRDCTCVCPPGRGGSMCEVHRSEYYDDSLPACSKTITKEMKFTSPNYPDYIPSGTWCMYTVEAPDGQVPEVIFHSFSFLPEQYLQYQFWCWDFLEVRDSNKHDGKVFCGTGIKRGQSFVGASRHLYLYMDASTVSSEGFKAEIKFHNASNPPEPKPGGVSCLSPSPVAVLAVFLAAQVFKYL